MLRILIPALLLSTPLAAHELDIGHGWMAATDHSEARAFVEIENHGKDAITIKAFRADWAAADLVGAPVKADGLEVSLADYPLTAGEHLEMEPEGVYIRLTGLTGPLAEGDEKEITMILASGEEFAIEIDVEGKNAENESHEGHNH